MKKFFIPIITLIVIISVIFNWWNTNSKALSFSEAPTRFIIPRGRSATQIGDRLFEAKLIKNPLAFKVYVQITGKAEKIQAGEFTLSPNFSLTEVIERLTSGPEELWVTIPEGLRREEIANRVIENLELEPEKAIVFRKEFLTETDGKEGFLFPDTYLFPRDVAASVVVGKLERTLDDKISEMTGAISSSGYSEKEIITLASIVERETKSDAERPVVAGIFFNRLKIGMALQVDATVQYAAAGSKIDNYWTPLTKDDLEIESPYNSYKYTGIPPGPISSPGLASIRAVVNPEDSDYLYYIHDSEGNIHYAKTLAEHNQNIRQYLNR